MNDAPTETPAPKSSTRGASFLIGGLAVVGLLVGVRRHYGEDCCAGHEIRSDQAVDNAFEGCKASCGSHSPTMRAAARSQPGAVLGDIVHCPVSGAVFRIKEDALKREVLGKSLYFCCASCAAYFDAHRTEILTARGIASGGA